MVQTMDKADISALLFNDLKGLIEVREIDQEKAKPRFFKSLEHFPDDTPIRKKHGKNTSANCLLGEA